MRRQAEVMLPGRFDCLRHEVATSRLSQQITRSTERLIKSFYYGPKRILR